MAASLQDTFVVCLRVALVLRILGTRLADRRPQKTATISILTGDTLKASLLIQESSGCFLVAAIGCADSTLSIVRAGVAGRREISFASANHFTTFQAFEAPIKVSVGAAKSSIVVRLHFGTGRCFRLFALMTFLPAK